MIFRSSASLIVLRRVPRILGLDKSGMDAGKSVQSATAPRSGLLQPQQTFHLRHFSSNSTGDGSVNIEVDVNDNLKIPGAEKGGRKLAAIYTCKICDTRSVKQFTERAYTYGVVIATCPGCNNRHLLADRLGYFDNQQVDLETIAKENGESLKSIGEGVTEIDLEDLIGTDKMKELVARAGEKTS